MSTASYAQLTRSSNMEKQALRPELQAIVHKIKSLRELTDKTGFYTHKEIGDLLRPLTRDELVAVNDALDLKPREIPQEVNKRKLNMNFNR